MSDELERLNRVLDDIVAERDPADRATLSDDEVKLAQMAAFLKTTGPRGCDPDPRFVERLAARLSARHARHPRQAPGMSAEPLTTDAGAVPLDEATMPMITAQPRRTSRRGLLGRIAVATIGAAAGAGAGEALRGRADTTAASAAYEQGRQVGYRQATSAPFSQPLTPRDRGRWFDTGQTVATLAPGEVVRFRAGAIEGFLMNPGSGKRIYALSAACTHMGCMLSWLDDSSSFLCPCHGAQYQADGTVLSGIARHPLPRLQVRVDDDGGIYVWSVGEQPGTRSLVPYEAP